jgi:hypothetical protein
LSIKCQSGDGQFIRLRELAEAIVGFKIGRLRIVAGLTTKREVRSAADSENQV